MQDEIKQIINQHIDIYYVADSEGADLDLVHFALRGIDSAAEAIANLVEEQPVDKMRAMATLAKLHAWNPYIVIVPGNDGHFYRVENRTTDTPWLLADLICWRADNGEVCESESAGDCDHIAAAKLYPEQKENKQ